MRRLLVFSAATLALALAGCGVSSVGRACTLDVDCDRGQTCYTDAPGGYCTKGCDAEGTSKDCPGGTLCAPHPGRLLCSNPCQADGDCRTNYVCSAVTGSEQKACVKPK
jgi:hypothetical protein